MSAGSMPGVYALPVCTKKALPQELLLGLAHRIGRDVRKHLACQWCWHASCLLRYLRLATGGGCKQKLAQVWFCRLLAMLCVSCTLLMCAIRMMPLRSNGILTKSLRCFEVHHGAVSINGCKQRLNDVPVAMTGTLRPELHLHQGNDMMVLQGSANSTAYHTFVMQCRVPCSLQVHSSHRV